MKTTPQRMKELIREELIKVAEEQQQGLEEKITTPEGCFKVCNASLGKGRSQEQFSKCAEGCKDQNNIPYQKENKQPTGKHDYSVLCQRGDTKPSCKNMLGGGWSGGGAGSLEESVPDNCRHDPTGRSCEPTEEENIRRSNIGKSIAGGGGAGDMGASNSDVGGGMLQEAIPAMTTAAGTPSGTPTTTSGISRDPKFDNFSTDTEKQTSSDDPSQAKARAEQNYQDGNPKSCSSCRFGDVPEAPKKCTYKNPIQFDVASTGTCDKYTARNLGNV